MRVYLLLAHIPALPDKVDTRENGTDNIEEIQNSDHAYNMLEDLYFILTNKKDICLIQTFDILKASSLKEVFAAVSAIQIYWNECYYYIIVTNQKIESNGDLHELIALLLKIEKIEDMHKDFDILQRVSLIYSSSPSAFASTEDRLCRGVVDSRPSNWEYMGGESYSGVLEQPFTIDQNTLQVIIDYFKKNELILQPHESFTRVFIESNSLDLWKLYAVLKNKQIYIVSVEGGRRLRSSGYIIKTIDDMFKVLISGAEVGSGYTAANTILHIDCYPL